MSLHGHTSWKFSELERWWKVGLLHGQLIRQEYSLVRASDQSRIFSNTGQSTLGKIGLGISATPKNKASRTAAIILGLLSHQETTPILTPSFGLMQRTKILQIVSGGDIGGTKKQEK